ncbi:MAG: biotin--[acetyl-CoA-carboxylase] ligase, partial [Pseudolabrys sp.]|nr:biotin--[acetyl-CoA-carboxylase] ligase [Pseudolabrys sp.]
YETLGSTNAEALILARNGERGPLWITAKAQTEGRGRRGNAWISTPGNLFATLLLHEPSVMAVAPQLSFVAALAAHDAIIGCGPRLSAPVTLKWPNDVLVGGKKVAGLLIEAEGKDLAIGFGINCVEHPPTTSYPATDLKEAGVSVSASTVVEALSSMMQRRLAQWDRSRGFDSIRADWLARAHGIGLPIRVHLPERELEGRFQGLDGEGRLLLENGASVEAITAGDVFPLAQEGRP